LLGLLIDAADGGDVFWWNVGLSENCTQIQPRNPYSPYIFVMKNTNKEEARRVLSKIDRKATYGLCHL
jgi:hypothetical protein